MEQAYLKSLHYCPMCGQVIGCGEGHCDSKEFQSHIQACRLAQQGKSGKMRYNHEEE